MALAPELTEELRYLEIDVGRRIRSLRLGQSRSPLKGPGYEFESHRKYEIGEDFRRIDWNVSARMQEIYLKRHFEEREVSVFLVVDVSRSMRFDGTNAKGSLRSMVDRKIAAEVINSQGERFAFSSLREYDCAAGKKGCQGDEGKNSDWNR